MNKDLRQIKSKYGEKMMQLCKKLFPSLLEEEGLLFRLLSQRFAYSKSLYYDIVDNNMVEEFKNYIHSCNEVYSQFQVDLDSDFGFSLDDNDDTDDLDDIFGFSIDSNENTETPQELLDKAGYKLYECHSEEEIQSFKHYYAPGEELCTFKGDRLDRCYVFFAVKKDVDNIKREDFKNPQRQDEYGTSVISIQFLKGYVNDVSIKNRYNHTVTNPDATFSNNLDNIIPGLKDSFCEHYDLNINLDVAYFEIPGYVLARDGKHYKYNCQINQVYYCTNNIIINEKNEVEEYDKSKYLIVDNYIIDLEHKTVSLYEDSLHDSFVDGLTNIKSINVVNDKESKTKKILIDNDIEIIINKENSIVSYKNNNIREVNDNFMWNIHKLQNLEVNNLETVGDGFLGYNKTIKSLILPSLKSVGDDFMPYNPNLEIFYAPNLSKIGKNMLWRSDNLSEYVPYLNELPNSGERRR